MSVCPNASMAAFVGSVAPCGIVMTLRRSMSKSSAQALTGRIGHHDNLISERHDIRSSTERWCWVGCLGTVCATTIDGTRSPAMMSVTSSPSTPPYMPCLILDDGDVALVQQLRAGRAGRRRAVDQLSDDPITGEGDPSATRTTLTSAPFADNPSDRAELKVATPQTVVDRY